MSTELTTPTVRTDRSVTSDYVTFRLAEQWIGIPVQIVQEVLVTQRISSVPLSADAIAGFLNLRGQIVTAVDLRVTLRLGARAPDTEYMNVVVRHEGELFALMVDEVGDVVSVAMDSVEAAQTTLASRWREACAGVVKRERGLLVLMHVEALLRLEHAST